MNIEWIIIGFVVVSFIAFLIFAFFFPEWVGIQGKKAEEIERSHRQDSDH